MKTSQKDLFGNVEIDRRVMLDLKYSENMNWSRPNYGLVEGDLDGNYEYLDSIVGKCFHLNYREFNNEDPVRLSPLIR